MICSNCGSEITPGSPYCSTCGAKAPEQMNAGAGQMNTATPQTNTNAATAQAQWQNPYTAANNAQTQGQSSYGAPQSGYGAAQNSYGTAQNGYGAARNNYGAAQNSYGAARNIYGTAQNGYGAAQNSYGTAQNSYGASQDSYGTAQNNYGAAQNSYGAAQSSYGAAQNYGNATSAQYNTVQNNYQMPGNSYAAQNTGYTAQNNNYAAQNYGYSTQTYDYAGQKDTFYVRKLPMVVIAILTVGMLLSAYFVHGGNVALACIIPIIQGITLLVLIYRLDKIEPEPIPLLVGLFFAGGLAVPVVVIMIGSVLDIVLDFIAVRGSIIFTVMDAFIVAALTEECCKYAALRLITWKHPAFNYRFDGVVYSTTVALGFELSENLLYMIGSDAGLAFTRSAFPGHCIFGIYMGYYYGQAKALENRGDKIGAGKLRRRGIAIAVLFHGFYDAALMLASKIPNTIFIILFLFAEAGIMCVMNVSAYKSIKEFAHEDKPV